MAYNSSNNKRNEKNIKRAMGTFGKNKGHDSWGGMNRKPKSKVIECTFAYSGRGFGFGVPVNPDEFEGDVFIPPKDTMGAMTGDIVSVDVTMLGGVTPGGTRKSEGVVKSIIEAKNTAIIGILHITDGYAYVVPSYSRINTAVYIPMKDVDTLGLSDNTKVECVPMGRDVFVRGREVEVYSEHEIPRMEISGRISNVFGSAATKEANYMAVLYENGIITEFPENVLRAAKESSEQPLTAEGRHDLRHLPIFTIDSASAKDLDDAISLEKTENGYILGVHIADVSHYVPFGGVVEQQAAERGTSVYFVDKVIPMLPEALSNGSCSLNAGQDKYAISAMMELDNDGNRISTRVFKSIISSKCRGVYTEVNDIFENGENSEFFAKYTHLADEIKDMKALYEILYANGKKRGVVELEDDEAVILLDETGFPCDIVKRERGDAEKMIEQFMLQANMGVAEVLLNSGNPCLYRIHEDPDPEKMTSLAKFISNIGIKTHNIENYSIWNASKKSEFDDSISAKAKILSSRLQQIMAEAEEKNVKSIVSDIMLRSMMKAKYSSKCGGHFGLGADRYCHFTSPIRRYPDYFVHTSITRTLQALGVDELTYINGNPPSDEESPVMKSEIGNKASDRAERSNDCEIRAVTAERSIEDLYIALYMSEHIGEEFDAVVSSVIRFGVFVRLPNLVEGLVPASMFEFADPDEELMVMKTDKMMYRLGSPMRVKLIEADLATGKLTFAPAEESGNN